MKYFIFIVFSIFAVFSAGNTLSAGERYKLNTQSWHCRAFFALSHAEQMKRISSVKFVQTTPPDTLVMAQEIADKRLLYLAQAKKALRVAANLQQSSVSNVAWLKSQGLEVVLMTAGNIDDIVTALNLCPDYVVLTPELDLQKTKNELLQHIHSSKVAERSYCNNYPLPPSRADGTEIRVLSYNILALRWGKNMPPFNQRMPGIFEVIRNAAPDFIGFQEMEPAWYDLIEKNLPPYRFAAYPAPAKLADIAIWIPLFGKLTLQHQYKSVMNGLMYDSSKYREIDGGIFPYTDTIIRCLRWTLLENIHTRKRYIFTNTHWHLTVPKRLHNSKIMAESINLLRQKYPGVPVFCTGDFNSRTESQEIQNFLNATGFHDAAATAHKSENKTVYSWYPPQSHTMPIDHSGHIDHVIYSPEFEALECKLLINDQLFFNSDHLPVVADLKRKN